jgi:ribose transport system substrate-binding protein
MQIAALNAWRSKRLASHSRLRAGICVVSFLCLFGACRSASPPTIAFIPRTSGTLLWEPAHIGAEVAAHVTQTKIYWNAPTREDDVQGQIALLERVIDRGYAGIVLAPDQALALISPVRRALSKGIPIVIIGSPLPISPGGKLSYILNDDEEAGRMAASRVAQLLHGKGFIAILGIDPDITGVMIRGRSLERALAQDYPEIRVVEKHMGSFNVPYEQQIAEETLRQNPNLNAIVALTSASTRGACSALGRIYQIHPVKLVGFDDPDISGPLYNEKLDSLIVQNSREMGLEAVETIAAQLQGKSVSPEIKLSPRLVTRENVDSAEVREIFSLVWRTEQ